MLCAIVECPEVSWYPVLSELEFAAVAVLEPDVFYYPATDNFDVWQIEW